MSCVGYLIKSLPHNSGTMFRHHVQAPCSTSLPFSSTTSNGKDTKSQARQQIRSCNAHYCSSPASGPNSVVSPHPTVSFVASLGYTYFAIDWD